MFSENNELEILYSEICRGYSIIEIELNDRLNTYYFRHPKYTELFELENQKNHLIEKGTANGLLSYDEAYKLLVNKGYWSEEEENQLNILQGFLDNLYTTRRKIHITQRPRIEEDIEKHEKLIENLLRKKNDVFPRTIESFITEQIYDLSIINFFYKNRELTKQVFDDESYYMADDEVINLFHYQYAQIANKFSVSKIRKLSSTIFFQNLLYVGGEYADSFFGKPTIELTNYQYQLFLSGKNFKTMIYNCAQIDKSIPQERMGDPDQMEEWHNNKFAEHKKPNKNGSSNAMDKINAVRRSGAKSEHSSLKK